MEMVGLDGFGVGFFAALIRVMAIGHDLVSSVGQALLGLVWFGLTAFNVVIVAWMFNMDFKG